jgi:hypothetical protein
MKGPTAEDVMEYCSVTASSIAAAALSFEYDVSPAAARAQKQQQRPLQKSRVASGTVMVLALQATLLRPACA